MDELSTKKSRTAEFLEELERELVDPFHKRLIQAYKGETPVNSMESELAKILMEVLHNEG